MSKNLLTVQLTLDELQDICFEINIARKIYPDYSIKYSELESKLKNWITYAEEKESHYVSLNILSSN